MKKLKFIFGKLSISLLHFVSARDLRTLQVTEVPGS